MVRKQVINVVIAAKNGEKIISVAHSLFAKKEGQGKHFQLEAAFDIYSSVWSTTFQFTIRNPEFTKEILTE